MAGLLADELKQPEVRDASLKIVLETGNRDEFRRPFLVELAQLAQGALVDQEKMSALPANVSELLKKIESPRERCAVASLAGKFLDLHGREEGLALLKQAASLPFTEPESALAVVDLRGR